MIYLIDDKEKRQQSFGWTSDILKKHTDTIQPIYNSIDLGKNRNEIFSNPKNCVLLHESFFDVVENKHRKDSFQIRSELVEYANKNQSFLLGIFSGSKNSRTIDKNIAHLPVAIVYQNLEFFLKNYNNANAELEYLLFGENPKIEKVLAAKFDIYKKLFNKDTLNNNISIANEISVINDTQKKELTFNEGIDVETFKKILND
jgi:hypothetical protein